LSNGHGDFTTKHGDLICQNVGIGSGKMMQNDQTSGANKREITQTRGELTGKTARLGHVEQTWIQGATNMRNRQFWDGSKPIIIYYYHICGE
jgi:hypothetical protein